MKKEANRKDEGRSRRLSNIRNAFVMVCVSVAMLSTATYAWFTVTSSPSVEGLKLTAATKGGLEISWDKSDWQSSIDIKDQPKDQVQTEKLTPVTVTDKTPAFKQAVKATGTNNGKSAVTDNDLEDVPTNENTLYSEYVAKYTYYLRPAGGSGTVSIGLSKNDSSDNGCYIKRTNAHSASESDRAEQAIRVGFKVDSNWIIYEPNCDKDTSSDNYIPHVSVTPYPVNDMVVQQESSGSFKKGSGGNSEKLFDISGVTEIEMYIWIEGTDRSCVNGIMTDELEGRIQFNAL